MKKIADGLAVQPKPERFFYSGSHRTQNNINRLDATGCTHTENTVDIQLGEIKPRSRQLLYPHRKYGGHTADDDECGDDETVVPTPKIRWT